MWFHDTTQQLTPLQPPKPEPPPLLIGCVSSVRYGTASPTAYRALGKVVSVAGFAPAFRVVGHSRSTSNHHA